MELKIALLVLMIAASAQAATECYNCNSGFDSGCNDPFSSNSKVSCDNKKCYKATGEVEGVKATLRGCGNVAGIGDCFTGEVTINGAKFQYLCCDGNNCNGVGVVSVHPMLVFVLIAVVFTFFMR